MRWHLMQRMWAGVRDLRVRATRRSARRTREQAHRAASPSFESVVARPRPTVRSSEPFGHSCEPVLALPSPLCPAAHSRTDWRERLGS